MSEGFSGLAGRCYSTHYFNFFIILRHIYIYIFVLPQCKLILVSSSFSHEVSSSLYIARILFLYCTKVTRFFDLQIYKEYKVRWEKWEWELLQRNFFLVFFKFLRKKLYQKFLNGKARKLREIVFKYDDCNTERTLFLLLLVFIRREELSMEVCFFFFKFFIYKSRQYSLIIGYTRTSVSNTLIFHFHKSSIFFIFVTNFVQYIIFSSARMFTGIWFARPQWLFCNFKTHFLMKLIFI